MDSPKTTTVTDVHFALYGSPDRMSTDRLERELARLPEVVASRIHNLRRLEDRRAGVIGKLLLCALLRRLTGQEPKLDQLEWDAYQRPYLRGFAAVDFNISHTHGLIACAVVRGAARVGIDVERVRNIDLSEFRRVFTVEEYANLSARADPTEQFYRLWTRKEAVMKADGRGFYLDAGQIDCLTTPVRIATADYRVLPLEVGNGFAGHVAAGGNAEIRLQKYQVGEFS